MAALMRNQPLLTPAELGLRLYELYAALREFNDGYFFESHETLEDLWMVTPLPERTLFQGIIQLAAAFVHVARGDYEGTFKLLDAAREKLQEFAPAALGIDVAALLPEIERCRGELTARGEEGIGAWDLRRAPKIAFNAAIGSQQ